MARVVGMSGMRGEGVHERAPWISVCGSKLVGDLLHWPLSLFSSCWREEERKARLFWGKGKGKGERKVLLALPKGFKISLEGYEKDGKRDELHSAIKGP